MSFHAIHSNARQLNCKHRLIESKHRTWRRSGHVFRLILWQQEFQLPQVGTLQRTRKNRQHMTLSENELAKTSCFVCSLALFRDETIATKKTIRHSARSEFIQKSLKHSASQMPRSYAMDYHRFESQWEQHIFLLHKNGPDWLWGPPIHTFTGLQDFLPGYKAAGGWSSNTSTCHILLQSSQANAQIIPLIRAHLFPSRSFPVSYTLLILTSNAFRESCPSEECTEKTATMRLRVQWHVCCPDPLCRPLVLTANKKRNVRIT